MREQVLAGRALPIKLTAHSPCFRSEAGSAGRDTRGMIRQHQFDKVEMVQIVHPEQERRRARRNGRPRRGHPAKLGLPYRVVLLCTGDMGFGRQDLRPRSLAAGAGHLPRDQLLLQLRGLPGPPHAGRFKNAQGKNEFVHTLNGSGLAVGAPGGGAGKLSASRRQR